MFWLSCASCLYTVAASQTGTLVPKKPAIWKHARRGVDGEMEKGNTSGECECTIDWTPG
jgi:hypothetical protein